MTLEKMQVELGAIELHVAPVVQGGHRLVKVSGLDAALDVFRDQVAE
jgi:hypothetical protein